VSEREDRKESAKEAVDAINAADAIDRMGRSAPVDLERLGERVRAELGQARGPALWRSLDELAGTPEFQEWLHREFPRQASEWVEPAGDGVSRRAFLALAGASLGLAGLTGCTKQPLERIVPYVRQPEEVVPGRPLYFASTHVHGGYGYGVIATSHTGRPTKIEGNPDHPASRGATDVFAQASVLGLYDPNRSQSIVNLGRIRTWGALVNEVSPLLKAQQALGGVGVRILTGAVTSPTFADQMKTVLEKYPKARWHRWEPAAPHDERRATVAALGGPYERVYDLTRAKVIVALDSDFLTQGPGSLRSSRDFARQRQVRHSPTPRPTMNRLYAVESSPTNTGTLADHRLPLPPEEVAAFALALAAALGVPGAAGGGPLSDRAQKLAAAAAKDLEANAGACLVVADGCAPEAVQVLALAMNEKLGNVGKTVTYIRPVEADPVDHPRSLAELVADLHAGKVEALFVLGANPVYTAPADFGFAEAYQKARLRVHFGLYQDETAQLSQWHVPESHPLETWSDARAFDGTASLVQPLIEPLYQSKSAHELLALFANQIDASAYDVVHAYWVKNLPAPANPGGDPEAAFRKALHDGVIPGTAEPAASVKVNGGAVQQAISTLSVAKPDPNAITLLLRPDPTVGDGRYAGNPWLQELPKPMTKLTWDNALVVGPALARRLKLAVEDVVEVAAHGRKVKAAVWIQPGHADRCATLHLGYGRWSAGPVGNGRGVNAYALRTADALWAVAGASLKKTGESFTLASTQNHHLLESGTEEIPTAERETMARRPVRTGTLAAFERDPNLVHEKPAEPQDVGAEGAPANTEEEISLYPRWSYNGYAWGMAIDLSVCTGCSACVVACQAENNIPTVGKDQVLKQRAMHWLRIDRYFEGDLDDPAVHHQPVPCMQCENAPCELVCPVAATTHSAEGLNDMVYNRCVGTRYCSNNCPYKVRRFNFLRYSNHNVPVLKLRENPDVTVRMRGVMEKCTYCVQRINRAKIDAEVAGRTVRPGDVQTACQQACPTEAIVFGDNNNPAWESTRRKAEPLNYALLEELNTRPRTTYLAKLTNPNPDLPADLQGDLQGRTRA
jgi:MoCo/4Fe-4S cofactor protein with predicted Tat translocation signal